MRVADAIERWGIANRSTIDASEIESLRSMWSTLRASKAGSVDIMQMEQNDSARIFALFAKPERAAVARTLKAVAIWVRDQPEASARPSISPSGGAARAARVRAVSAQQAAMHRRRRMGLVLAGLSGSLLLVLVLIYAVI